jgi:hypothetical protein
VGAISWNSFAARAEPVRLTTYGIRHYPQAQEYSPAFNDARSSSQSPGSFL